MTRRIGKRLDSTGRERAGHACEYCQLPEHLSDLPHVLDHIIARQHGGRTILSNLALCCGRCNLS
jgi:5-methylcytosine-specific restriction endonuclease McrA